MKFELTEETKVNNFGVLLYRIKALKDFKNSYNGYIQIKKGDLGGWVESEDSLSQKGLCWVAAEAEVFNKGLVLNDSMLYGNAQLYNSSILTERAWIGGSATVHNNSIVKGVAHIFEQAVVKNHSTVSGCVVMQGLAVADGASLHSRASIGDEQTITGDCINFTRFHEITITMTDRHIKYGCVTKTKTEWRKWLASDEVIETPRDTKKKFEEIKKTLEYLLSVKEIK